MPVGTATGRTVSTTITAPAGGLTYVVQTIAAAAVDLLIVEISKQKGTAPECDLVAVKLPTAVGASGPTTDAFITWKLAGPGGAQTYPVVLNVAEVDTTA
jgi:hypothetical protein